VSYGLFTSVYGLFRSAKQLKFQIADHIDLMLKIRMVHSGKQNSALDKCTVRNNDRVWTRRMPMGLKGEDSMYAVGAIAAASAGFAQREQE
jgi:hypothetical protein